jgi:hypothetical protein
MKLFWGLVVGLGLALTLGVSSAEAAKGTKKKGEQKIHGKVLAVHHHKGGGGSITVKVHHHKKKTGQSTAAKAAPKAPAAGSQHHGKTFHIGKHTHIEAVQGKLHQTVGFAALHAGEHVTVLAKGQNAEKVDIHVPHQKVKLPTVKLPTVKRKK